MGIRMLSTLFSVAAMLTLVACSTTSPFSAAALKGGERHLSPAVAASSPEGALGRTVLWGGRIVSVHNLTDRTELRILAYPLDSRGDPLPARASQGRFVAISKGYLEPVDFSSGRMVTVYGTLQEMRTLDIDGARVPHPVVAVRELHLWPLPEPNTRPAVHFGIGIGVGL